MFNFNFISTRNTTEEKLYAYWRFRIIAFLIIGYAGLYFLRQNFSLAMPGMMNSLGFSKQDLGKIITFSGIFYGFGKGLSGILADRSSARILFFLCILLSAICNIFMGTVSSLLLIGIIWTLNSCVQSIGAPVCAKVLAHWYGKKGFGAIWAIWSSSQHVGSAIVCVCVISYAEWRYAFYAPGILCLFIAAWTYFGIRNEPKSVGLTDIEKREDFEVEDECAEMTSFQIFRKQILRNKMVWAMGIANFFTYFVKMSFFNWALIFLNEAKGISLRYASCQLAVLHLASILGAIHSGMLSDRFFKGYRGRVGFFSMVFLAISILAMLFVPGNMPILNIVIMLLVGYFLAGPQTMVGIAVVDFSSKKAAGSANGLTGVFGYLGTATTGIGTAYLAEHWGWNWVFSSMFIASIICAICFLFTWNARSKVFEKKMKNAFKV